jgi:hypothetical protein
LVDDINQAEREQAERNISGAPFAILWLLKQENVPLNEAEGVAREMTNVLEENPHWHTSERDARAVRIALYRHLPETMTNKPEVVEHIMSVVRRERR